MRRSRERSGREWNLVAIGAGVACLGAAFAVSDAAGSDAQSSALSTRQATATILPAQAATRAPRCPKGQRAVSGGFANPNFEIGGPRVYPYVSRKQRQRRWRTSAYNDAPLNNGTLRAFTYCDRIGPLVTRAASRTLPTTTRIGTAVAICPKGRKAVSGGFAHPGFDPDPAGGAQIAPFVSRKAGQRRWRVSAYNRRFNTQGTFRAFVYCLKTAKRVVTRRAQTAIEAGGTGVATARCPRGRTLVSGGFASPTYNLNAVGMLPFVSRKAGGRGWRVAASNEGTATGALRAFANCL